jgi:hypothetical protein
LTLLRVPILFCFSRLANINGVTAIGCTGDLVFTGGQFGKAFARNIKTKQFSELIDQAQAHKRKIIVIKSSNDYIYTAGADQKVKQWSAEGLKMIWSTTLNWIPASLTIDNGTLRIGGPSRLISVLLAYQDRLDPDEGHTSSKPSNPKKISQREEGTSQNIFVFFAGALAIVMVLVFVLIVYRYKSVKRINLPVDPKLNTESASVETQTLVTQILKIALPGYKELTEMDFRILRKLAKGGGGEVFLGEALSKKSMVFGHHIIVKQFGGKVFVFLHVSSKFWISHLFATISNESRNFFDGILYWLALYRKTYWFFHDACLFNHEILFFRLP